MYAGEEFCRICNERPSLSYVELRLSPAPRGRWVSCSGPPCPSHRSYSSLGLENISGEAQIVHPLPKDPQDTVLFASYPPREEVGSVFADRETEVVAWVQSFLSLLIWSRVLCPVLVLWCVKLRGWTPTLCFQSRYFCLSPTCRLPAIPMALQESWLPPKEEGQGKGPWAGCCVHVHTHTLAGCYTHTQTGCCVYLYRYINTHTYAHR